MRAERSRECRADGDPPLAQYTLLYAVLFCDPLRRWTRFRSQEQLVWASSIQCTVTINNFVKFYIPPYPSTETAPLQYPSNTFSSRWNCVLDLAAYQAQALDAIDVTDSAGGHLSILSEPASPFPYLQPTPPPPPARITPAPALQHTPLDRHLKPLARGPP